MKTDFDKLQATKHMLAWLSNSPFEEMIATITDMFAKQSPNTKMLSFEITDNPDWLTGGTQTSDNRMTVTRCAMAVLCEFTLQNDDGVYPLKGVFSWVGVNLDSKPKTKMWMDLDGTIEEFGGTGLLQQRIYELQ